MINNRIFDNFINTAASIGGAKLLETSMNEDIEQTRRYSGGKESNTTMLSVSIYSLEQAIKRYNANSIDASYHEKSWKDIPWIWEHIPWYIKLLRLFGIISSDYVQKKWVLSSLCKAAHLHLSRYFKGEWRRQDEERLHSFFSFFSTQQHLVGQYFNKEINDIFIQGEAPLSFINIKEIFKKKFLSLHLPSTHEWKSVLLWQRHETLSQYLHRLELFEIHLRYKKGHSVDRKVSSTSVKKLAEERAVGTSKEKNESERTDSVAAVAAGQKKTFQNRHRELEQYIQSCRKAIEHEIHECCALQAHIQNKIIIDAVVVRFESHTLIHEAESLYKSVFSFLLSLEDLHEVILKFVSIRIESESKTQEILCSVIEVEKKTFELRQQSILFHQRAKEIEEMCCYILNTVHAHVYTLFKTIDAVPLLPVKNVFRTHEMRLLKTAREKLKQFRLLTTKVPGPETSVKKIGYEITTLVDLAKAFYEEGKEIEVMHQHLQSIAEKIQGMLTDSSYKTKNTHRRLSEQKEYCSKTHISQILDRVSFLIQNLATTADRKNQFEEIIEELSQYERR